MKKVQLLQITPQDVQLWQLQHLLKRYKYDPAHNTHIVELVSNYGMPSSCSALVSPSDSGRALAALVFLNLPAHLSPTTLAFQYLPPHHILAAL